MSGVRLCDYRWCGKRLDPDSRPEKRYCGDSCRTKEWDLRNPRKRSGSRATASRRPSRDGTGAHVYLTANELAAVVYALHIPDSARRKIQAAHARTKENR